MYNYRYDKNGHAWNMNPPANFNMQGNGTDQSSESEELSPEDQQIAAAQAQIDELKKRKSAVREKDWKKWSNP